MQGKESAGFLNKTSQVNQMVGRAKLLDIDPLHDDISKKNLILAFMQIDVDSDIVSGVYGNGCF
jgi:hypothetical protein